MTEFTGHCHCGQTEWTAKLQDAAHILCHCDTCKQLGGGAYSLNQIVPESDLKITKGTTKTYTYYGESGKPVNCYYCPNCTTHVYHHQTVMGDKLVVRTVLLDGGKDLKPAAEIFGKAKMSWEPEVAQTFDTLPPH
ncbi:MAG: hypothetical protein FRX48_00784 [Lasallia pustulata]|uniref:CENP-V/GFA domain-containing protein n=1 Tax=Lasallia pustulata TaxID=136370 RepID=A0A5M8Q4C9_9LECA|nr:MAG: hypothetical protein FRX48_00784 [Lasallia pustulata]